VSTLLSIGDFSRMTFLSVKALRHYHDLGLLKPAAIDPETGYRRYEVGQIASAQAIRRLRELGMPLEDVRSVIEAPEVRVRNEAISAHLGRMEIELERTRATVKSLRLLLDARAPSSIAVDYRALGPTETLAIRDNVGYADASDWLDRAFSELRSAEHQAGADRVGADAALYSSELLEDEHGEIVAVIPVQAAAVTAGRIERLSLPRVEYAIAVHVGSLDEIDRTYAALGTVVAQRAIGVQGPIRENYVVGPPETLDEAARRTEICWPIFQTTTAR
jgi:DNA-binding transcriptional MerR regulator